MRAIFEEYGVDSLEAMETMAADADKLAHDAEDKERQLSLALDGEELSALRTKRKSCPKLSVLPRTYPATSSRFAALPTWTGL